MPPAAPASELDTLSTRLERASAAARDANDAAKAELERRDRLVVDAIREGLGYTRVTELTGLSRTRIIAIIARAA
jgi:flagellar basal body-associated protein FliL